MFDDFNKILAAHLKYCLILKQYLKDILIQKDVVPS